MEALVAQNQAVHGTVWYKRKDLLYLNLFLCSALITSATNGYDGSMMNGLQTLKYWENYFNTPTGSTLGLFNAIQNIGSIAAIPFSPFLADGIGRRPTIMLGASLMLVGVVLQSAAQSIGMFIAARGIIGFGLQWAQMAAPMLITELAYPSHRAGVTSLFNSLWYLGAVIAAWATYGTFFIQSNWSWRIPSILQGLPSIFQLSLIYFLPESPRFLVRKEKEAQAAKVLANAHANGDINDPLVAFELAEIREAIAMDDEAARTTTFLTLLMTKGNRKRLAIIIPIAFFSQWSGNGLVSYYIHAILTDVGITSAGVQLVINAVLQVWNLFCAITAAFTVERFGRRRLFLVSNTGMLFAWTIWTALAATYVIHNNVDAGKAVVAFVFVYYTFYDIAYSPLLVSYTVEILPYRLRAKGLALMNFCVSASLVFNQYINPIAQKHIGWKYYIVYCVWLLFELIYVYFFVIETKGRTLEETAALFDGEDVAQELSAKGEQDLRLDTTAASETKSGFSGDEKSV